MVNKKVLHFFKDTLYCNLQETHILMMWPSIILCLYYRRHCSSQLSIGCQKCNYREKCDNFAEVALLTQFQRVPVIYHFFLSISGSSRLHIAVVVVDTFALAKLLFDLYLSISESTEQWMGHFTTEMLKYFCLFVCLVVFFNIILKYLMNNTF